MMNRIAERERKVDEPSKDYPRLAGDSFAELIHIVEVLRGGSGCPWDAEQTFLSLRRHFLEEAYEVMEAMDTEDREALSDELGDIVIHLLFQNDIARKEGSFDWISVLGTAADKLKRRHPHVFGEVVNRSVEEVERQWEMTKRAEEGRRSILKELPKGLPALAVAASILKRMERAGVTCETVDEKVFSIPENTDPTEVESQAGELLLQAVSEIQQAGADPETVLRAAAARLRQRVKTAESKAGAALDEISPDVRKRVWSESTGEQH